MIPAGKANIITIDKKTIKSNGNLPIPHSEKAKANVVSCILIFLRQKEFNSDYKILNIGLAKIIDLTLNSLKKISRFYSFKVKDKCVSIENRCCNYFICI